MIPNCVAVAGINCAMPQAPAALQPILGLKPLSACIWARKTFGGMPALMASWVASCCNWAVVSACAVAGLADKIRKR